MANIMRFVILGDDRGGPAFATFTRQVERANKAVDRNNAALKRQGAAATEARGGILGLAGEVTGFGAAMGAANSKGSLFGRVLAGVNLATGLLEPVLAGAVVTVGALGAGLVAAGAGLGVFGAVAAGALGGMKKQMQQISKLQAQLGAPGQTAAQQAAIQKQITAAQKGFNEQFGAAATGIERLQKAWHKLQDSQQKPVLNIAGRGLNLAAEQIPKMAQFLPPVEKALNRILDRLSAGFKTKGFNDFLAALAKASGPIVEHLGNALINIGIGIGGIVKAFLPMSQVVFAGLDKLTAKFAAWGSTLSQHTGFASLMTMFREETPLAVQVLKNLGTVLLNVGRAMTGIASPANSKALLQMLVPLSQLLVVLSRNQALVRILLYLYAIKSASDRVKPAIVGIGAAITGLKTGVGAAQATVNWMGRLRDGFTSSAAAASAFSGTAGTIGGKLRSAVGAVGAAVVAVKAWTVWSRVATVATWAWNLAMRALPFVAIATAVAALVYVVIKYHRQIWAFAVRAWHAIWDTITSVVGSILSWVRGHWPLIVSILGGPVGAVAVLVIRHWNQIRNGAVTAFNTVIGFFRGIPGRILAALGKIGGLLYNKGKDVIQGFWNGLTAVWRSVTGWISGIASWIKAHKGPVSLDASLLYPAGHALMSGFLSGLKAGFGPVGSFVGGIASWVLGKIKGAGGKLLGGKIVLDTSQFSAAALSGAVGGDAAANRALARRIFPWPASMWPAFDYLEMREAGYNRFARNPSSGAYGIPQALPPTKMPFAAQAAGGSHAGAQLSWMFAYIRSVYGNPVNAAAHERAFNWYASGTRSAARGWAWVGERGPELVRFRGGEQVGPVYAGNGAGGGGNTYQITVNVPPTASKADVGRTVVEAIRAYEKGSGSGWRK